MHDPIPSYSTICYTCTMLMNRTMGSLTYGVSKVRFQTVPLTYCFDFLSPFANPILGRYYPLRRAPCWSIPSVSHLYRVPCLSISWISSTSTIYHDQVPYPITIFPLSHLAPSDPSSFPSLPILSPSSPGSSTLDRSQRPSTHDVESRRSTKLAKLTNSMKIRVNTICPGIFPSEMTGVNSSSERAGHNYDMGDAANKADARSTAGK